MLKILDGEPGDFARYATHLSALWPRLPVALRCIQCSMVDWRQIAGLREQPSIWVSLHDAGVEMFEYEPDNGTCHLTGSADDDGDAIPFTLAYRDVTSVEGDLSSAVGQTMLYHEVDSAPDAGWTHRMELSRGLGISLTCRDVSLTIGVGRL